jgi:hypothetical protein
MSPSCQFMMVSAAALYVIMFTNQQSLCNSPLIHKFLPFELLESLLDNGMVLAFDNSFALNYDIGVSVQHSAAF